MITHPQKQRFAFASYRRLLPLAVLLVMAFATKAEKNNKFSVPQRVDPERQDAVNASFPGGEREQAMYLSHLINADRYYKDSIRNRQGTVNVQFTVDETGNLKDFVAVEDDIPYIANLITKYLKEGPVWTPKKVNGQPVPSIQRVLLKVSVDKWGVMGFAF